MNVNYQFGNPYGQFLIELKQLLGCQEVDMHTSSPEFDILNIHVTWAFADGTKGYLLYEVPEEEYVGLIRSFEPVLKNEILPNIKHKIELLMKGGTDDDSTRPVRETR